MSARIALLFALIALAPVYGQERQVESVVPALAFGGKCRSTVTMQNLGDRVVLADLEAHKPGGALAPIEGHSSVGLRLKPGERVSYRPEIDEETESGWVKVREHVPSRGLDPVLAVSGATECVIGNELKNVGRDVVYPTRNPWFSGDVSELNGALMSLINTTERAATASLCYSAGNLFYLPGKVPSADLLPVCSDAFDVQIPPFGAREFPVSRDGSTHFSLKTQGTALVIEMLRPLGASIKMYTVDSTIHFGGEVGSGR
ncbi:MAG TPA: hypothetical protein VHW09_11285 [Bryobacteraceae bacterium]|jgi:hypothetical protein|nr:hypothetical protein [Bryobacteraceae bacterium]